jgi:hypothetical protein
MVSISHPSMAPSTQEKSGDPSESEPLGAAESLGGMEERSWCRENIETFQKAKTFARVVPLDIFFSGVCLQ